MVQSRKTFGRLLILKLCLDRFLLMTKTKYILLLRDIDPVPRKDGKLSKVYNWAELRVEPLEKLRAIQSWLKENGSRHTKIIREETTISVVKKVDLK